MIITKDKDKGTYQIASAATPSRILAKNNTANLGFGFYTGSQTKDLTLIPAEYVKLPEITLDPSTLTLSYNDTETHYIPVTLKNAETQDVSVAIYDGTEGTEQPDWITTGDYNGSENRLEVAATENTVATPRTARIVLTATTSLGTAQATLTVEQAAAGAKAWVSETFENYKPDAGSPYNSNGTFNGVTTGTPVWTYAKCGNPNQSKTDRTTLSNTAGITVSSETYLTIGKSGSLSVTIPGGITALKFNALTSSKGSATLTVTVGGKSVGTLSITKNSKKVFELSDIVCNGQDATIKIEQNTENRTTIGDFSWQLE